MTTVTAPGFSVAVVQMGARRGYELARMLHDRGVLSKLYTSTAWPEGQVPSRVYRFLSGIDEGVIRRRTVKGIPAERISTTFIPEPFGAALSKVGFSDQSVYAVRNELLGASVKRMGLGAASVLLNSTGNGGSKFLHWAKRRGLSVATEVVITPKVYSILAAEHLKWPKWRDGKSIEAETRKHDDHIRRVVAASDLLLSPSDTVDDGLTFVPGFDAGKLVRVPYGLGAVNLQVGQPKPKTVLFAGQVGLRKGVPYLAEAARLLEPHGYEFRLAGFVPETVRALPECSALHFLGHLGPEQMSNEFRAADVFCLPSLAEGMASVTLEALAFGLPCVVTRSSGAPVQEGTNGKIVPERDGAAIAEAVREICEQRILRDQMSKEAHNTAKSHTLKVVGDTLYDVLSNLVNGDG